MKIIYKYNVINIFINQSTFKHKPIVYTGRIQLFNYTTLYHFKFYKLSIFIYRKNADMVE